MSAAKVSAADIRNRPRRGSASDCQRGERCADPSRNPLGVVQIRPGDADASPHRAPHRSDLGGGVDAPREPPLRDARSHRLRRAVRGPAPCPLPRVRPDARATYNLVPERAASVAARASRFCSPSLGIRSVPLRELVATADIICTRTSVGVGEGPVFEDGVTRPHLHVNAVGADLPNKFEIPLALLKRSLVVPDFPAQTALEGECQRLEPADIGPPLSESSRTRNSSPRLGSGPPCSTPPGSPLRIT